MYKHTVFGNFKACLNSNVLDNFLKLLKYFRNSITLKSSAFLPKSNTRQLVFICLFILSSILSHKMRVIYILCTKDS